MKNLCGKMRKTDKPYEVWTSADGTWKWLVLKKWQANDNKPYARWFCAVQSPFTCGRYDMGDCYVKDVKSNATLTYVDPTLAAAERTAAVQALDVNSLWNDKYVER